ncbi:hypothetical protein [Kitasatospora cineracea]|uniref:hypothetical protein n=1 Tax=Kitasatospora cineracea TaxID=88074 RepID=UPI003817931D
MTRVIRGTVLLTAFLAAWGMGIVLEKVAEDRHNGAAVVQFNKGFRDAKQDDCEQGFRPACEWLEVTK